MTEEEIRAAVDEFDGDLIVVREEDLPPKPKARVYLGDRGWTWDHDCWWHTGRANGYPHATQPEALDHALRHWHGCL